MNEIDSNIWLFDLPTWFFDLFLFVIKFIFSNFIFFFSKISLCKITKFLYCHLYN
jgi:hypothetical protein